MSARSEEDTVRATLEALSVPEAKSVWVGPFEQLQGAGYSLMAAKRHGIYSRDISNYHERVRTKIVALLLEQDTSGQVQDKSVLDNSLAGFYFNAAVQRIVWASERLTKTFVGIPCGCGRGPEEHANSRQFPKLLKDARVRIEHLKSDDRIGMAHTAGMLDQFPGVEYKRETLFNSKFTLAMLRYDVNNRKHLIFGPLARDRRKTRGNGSNESAIWSSTPQDTQMRLACRAFCQVCVAYDELKNWQPSASAYN